MYTLLICTAIGAAYGLLTSCFFGDENWTRKNTFTRVGVFTVLLFILGCFVAGKFARESIPLREYVAAEVAIGAPRNPDGTTGTFVVSRKDSEWEFRVYVYWAKAGENTLVHGVVPHELPVVIVEDASLTDSGTLLIYERERDSSDPKNDWAIFQSTDKRLTKYVFKIPPGKMVMLPAK